MKIDPHSVPLLATLSLFVYLIWPHLFMDARPSVVTGAAVSTKVPGDVDLVKTHTGPRRDPFLKSFNDSYPDMPKAHEVHDKQMSKITGGGEASPDQAKASVLPPLVGTVVSGDYCCAYIGGRLYETGDILDAGGNNIFRVKKITVGHVTLESTQNGAIQEMIPELEHPGHAAAREGDTP